MGSTEDDFSVLIGNAIEADDIARNEFFHNILGLQILLIEVLQLLIVGDLPGRIGSNAIIRFHNDRIADFLYEFLSFGRSCYQMVAGNWYTSLLIEGFHIGLGLVAHDRITLVAGRDIEVRTQTGILFQPEFIIAFKPVNLAMFMCKPGNGTIHLVIIHH